MVRSPETKKPAPAPPKGLRGPFSDFRAAQPCFVTIFVFYFPPIFFDIFAKVYTSIFRIRPQKNFGTYFWDIFHFLFSKVESARADAPGPKTQNAPSNFSGPTPKSEEKFYFLSFYTIYRPAY